MARTASMASAAAASAGLVAASGAEGLLSARRAAASAAKPPVQDFHDESVTTAPRTTYSETAGATPDLGGLARGRRDDHPQVWRAPRDSRAYVSTPPPALLRLLL